MYIRLGKAGEKIAHIEKKLDLKIGDIVPVMKMDRNKKAVIACGNILASAKQQIETEQLPYDLYSVPFVKPLNKECLNSIVARYQEGLITIEEHQRSCGMGSAIVEQLNDMFAAGEIATYPKVKRIAIPDEFVGVVGNQQYLREVEKLSL
jgi:transketolase